MPAKKITVTPDVEPETPDETLVVNAEEGRFTHTQTFTDMMDETLNGRYTFKLLTAQEQVAANVEAMNNMGQNPNNIPQGVFDLALAISVLRRAVKTAPAKDFKPAAIFFPEDAIALAEVYYRFANTFRRPVAAP